MSNAPSVILHIKEVFFFLYCPNTRGALELITEVFTVSVTDRGL